MCKMEEMSETDNLEDLLLEEEMDEDIRNSSEYMEWENFFANSYTNRKKKNNLQYKRKRENQLQFMFSWFLRMKNIHKKLQKIIQFSIFLYYEGCPQKIWRVLSRLRLAFSYSKTCKLMKLAESIKIPEIKRWPENKYFLEVGADNCAYFNNIPIDQMDQESHFTNTINWYIKYSYADQEIISDDFRIFPKKFNENFIQLR